MAAPPPPPGAPPSPAPRRRAGFVLLGLLVVAALIAGGVLLATRSRPTHHAVAAPPPTAAAPIITSTPLGSPSLVPRPSHPSRPAPTVPHDHVAAAAPTTFTFRSPKFTVRADVCGMAYVRPLDPPGEQHHTVCWVQRDFGVAPASAATGTTYVLGHSWGQDPREVLNDVSSTAMRQVLELVREHRTTLLDGVPTYAVTALTGDTITLRTAKGTLTYTVRSAYAVAKAQAGSISSLMNQHTRNRLVLITCGERDHVDYDDNIIVQAYLTSSVATNRTA